MALVGNGSVLNKSAGKWLAGGAAAHASGVGQNYPPNPANWARSSEWAKFGLQDRSGEGVSGEVVTLAAKPDGYYPSAVYALPVKAGAIKALYTTEVGIDTVGTALAGLPGEGSSTLGFTAAATGGLITSGSGSATFGVDTNTPLLTASLNADGSAAFGIDTNSPVLGAVAEVTGSADFGFAGTGARLPADDTPPARTASATFGIEAVLTSYAVGIMEGSTADTGLTVDNVVRGVWSAAAADYNVAGTTGSKLNSASSAGDPWSTALPGSYADGEAGKIISDIKEKTDSLTFTVPGKVDANLKNVADVAVDGSGTSGDPWGPA